jgi:hypothetical protein
MLVGVDGFVVEWQEMFAWLWRDAAGRPEEVQRLDQGTVLISLLCLQAVELYS